MTPKYAPKEDFRTNAGNVAPDYHLVSGEFTDAEKSAMKKELLQLYPRIQISGEATAKFNCHAFAHAARHAWFNEIDQFLKDDYYQYTPGTLLIGDVCVYMDGGVFQHSGVITGLNGATTITEVESKWGKSCQVKHAPTDVPAVYGKITHYLRKKSLLSMELYDQEQIKTIQSLISGLLSEENRLQLSFASTTESIHHIITNFPEVSTLRLYGPTAAQQLIRSVKNHDEFTHAVFAVLLEKIGDPSVLPYILEQLSRDEESISPSRMLLLQAYEALNLRQIVRTQQKFSNRINELKKELKK